MTAHLHTSPVDDSFHPPASADPYWTETAWFGFSAPEVNLNGAIYPLFRPNQHVCSVGVYIWDGEGEEPHNALYAKTYWHVPLPDEDLTDLTLPVGLRYRRVEPLAAYEIAYADGDVTLGLRFDALHPPFALALGEHGHLDQAGRVTGVLRWGDRAIDIDCLEMRDRSWSVRNDSGPVRAGYDYCLVDERNGFCAMSMWFGDSYQVIGGYWLRDGDVMRLVGGTRSVERDHDKPVRARVEARTQQGDQLLALGTCTNRFAMQSSPNYFAWMSGTSWELDGVGSGHGQDQDVWSPDQLRAARRAPAVAVGR